MIYRKNFNGRGSAALCALLFATQSLVACLRTAVPHLPDDTPGLPPGASDFLPSSWAVDVKELWSKYGHSVSFCLGNSPGGVADILYQSFPLPLPTGGTKDLICSNAASIEAHLCEPEAVLMYYEYLLRTEDLEKVPSNAFCRTGSDLPSCSPGFFANNITGQPTPHACCPGYFCPAMLTCMIPCPLGSHCPRAWAADPPAGYLDYDLHQKFLIKSDKWCAPYAYKERPETGCGGADRWTILPTGAFPGLPWMGSGNLFCDGGWFCPNTSTKLQCKEGHYCRQGSTEMMRCPPLASCPPGTQTPLDNYAGVALDLMLFALLGIMWRATRLHASFMRSFAKRERLALALRHFGFKLTITDIMAEKPAAGSFTAPSDSPQQPLLPGSPYGQGHVSSRFLFWRRRTNSTESAEAAPAPVWAPIEVTNSADEMRQAASRTPSIPMQPVSTAALLGSAAVHEAALPETPPSRAYSVREDELRADTTLTVDRMSSGHGFDRNTPKVLLDVEFWRLALTLKRTKARVLDGACGRLQAARLTAIMGPSGAGKTTLMSTLAGKTPYGVRTGLVLVNGKQESLDKYRPVMGFVPQEDIMYRCLTVEEVLLFSARLRLAAGSGAGVHVLAVEHALQVLGLAEIRHQVIGDEETRGISGGQRKRVNVGIELVADPSLLFLDEPTSGLDSTASRLVVAAVSQVAQQGVTAAAVIHQPSWQVFCMFDDVILLAKGGRTAYYGPSSGVQDYFETIGLSVPQNMNPADAFLDFITGSIAPSATPHSPHHAPPAAAATFDLGAHWESLLQPPAGFTADAVMRPLDDDELSVASSRQSDSLLGWARSLLCLHAIRSAMSSWLRSVAPSRGSAAGAGESIRVQPGFRQQVGWWCSRAAIRKMREPMATFTEYAIYALTGSLLGLMSTRGRGNILRFAGDTMYTIVALGLLSSVSGLKTFGRDRVVFFREAASGLHRAAFFVALDIMDMPAGLLRSAAYLVMYCSFAQPRAVAWQMYAITAAIVYACTGSAYFLSIVLDPGAAQLTAAVLALVNTLMAHRHNTQGLMQWAQTFSFARWGLEGYIIAESNRLVGVWLLARCADLMALGYDVTQFWHCILVLLGLGLVGRAAACGAMYVMHRDKQV